MLEKLRNLRISRRTTKPSEIASIDNIEEPRLLAQSIFSSVGEKQYQPYNSYLRISSLHDVCPREHFIGFFSEKEKKKFVDTSLKLTFDIGNAIHFWLQNSPDYFGNRRIGWFLCKRCGRKFFGKRGNGKCFTGDGGELVYVEHSMRLEEPYRVTGHPDMFYEAGGGDIRVLEIKTINGPDFEKLQSPLYAHIVQVTAYMHLLPLDATLPVSIRDDKAILLYVSKTHSFNKLPVKAFHVEKDSLILDYIEKTLKAFADSFKERKPPEPLIKCVEGDFRVPPATQCPVKEECKKYV